MILLFCFGRAVQGQEEEKTYSISLTKTAETKAGERIHEVDNRKVLAQEYTVRNGDHVWQLLRERGLLQQQNLAELLSVFKKMNKSLHNLDLIHPGEKLIIPLKIAPLAGGPTKERAVRIEDLGDINFREYTVKKDDYLIRIVKGMYRIPQDALYKDYLYLFKKLNPSVKDLNTIYPGQRIRLPIYSPEVVRAPIQTSHPSRLQERNHTGRRKKNPVAGDLAGIFTEMGEEWVQSGEHFIPLKSGGQIKLSAASFPIIDTRKGMRVIVDLNNELPARMAHLIESGWSNYRVVHLTKKDDLRSSLKKTIHACSYPEVFGSGKPLVVGRDIQLRISGDWIIRLSGGVSRMPPTRYIVINLRDASGLDIPTTIRKYMVRAGIKVIDYPPVRTKDVPSPADGGTAMKPCRDPRALTKTVLDLAGISFSEDMDTPVYQTRKNDIKLIIKSDFSLKLKGRNAVIDLTGLAPDVMSLLEERQFLTLCLASEKDPVKMAARLCEFLGVQFRRGPQSFKVASAGHSKNIMLRLPGIIFFDSTGTPVLVTPLNLPDNIDAFLSHEGYRVLYASFS